MAWTSAMSAAAVGVQAPSFSLNRGVRRVTSRAQPSSSQFHLLAKASGFVWARSARYWVRSCLRRWRRAWDLVMAGDAPCEVYFFMAFQTLARILAAAGRSARGISATGFFLGRVAADCSRSEERRVGKEGRY